MTQPTQPPLDFLTLTVFGGRLYAINRAGQPMPLYVYAPLRQAYAGRYDVPLAPQWPPYTVDFVTQYVPMPILTPEQLPDTLEADITQQARTGDPERPWNQMVYRGWPLYYVPGLDASGTNDAQPAMFEPAREGMDPPMVQGGDPQGTLDDGDPGWPPGVWGP
ncbi:hypothetical protein IHN63_19915 [Deinococcus sp. 6YEL10]|uniref:hypothetical protein n=1 Tax=Deinococcus sp. 6YEL10 TaxID=2745870 RepID=UPI001E3A9455|nr:hypothetical protein [Deinococcus sp. 6YEL10]MCD0163562.1 hypothetical protein [Deinococcus sp. 6YEL10]